MKLEDLKSPHFIGIGGAGMSALARIFLAQGAKVSGSDSKDSETVKELKNLGALIYIGHDEKNLSKDSTCLIISKSAIKPDNPEILAAKKLGIPIHSRAEVLSEIILTKTSVAVAGTHGKTSTSAMLITIARYANLDPSFAVGGEVISLEANASNGSGEHFIFEADESDGAIVLYKPDIGIITNIEPDHLDHFKTNEAYKEVFIKYSNNILKTLILCLDDPGCVNLYHHLRSQKSDLKILTYAKNADAEALIEKISYQDSIMNVEAKIFNKKIEYSLKTPGEHMALNALAAICAATEMGLEPEVAAAGVSTYGGAKRRFDIKGTIKGITIVDDYAHHPTEVQAVIKSAKEYLKSKKTVENPRLAVIFQPHMFSRTQEFAKEFKQVLTQADKTWILPIYHSRETPIPGVTSELIGKQSTIEEVIDEVKNWARPGDIIITMGAGDITDLAPILIKEISEN